MFHVKHLRCPFVLKSAKSGTLMPAVLLLSICAAPARAGKSPGRPLVNAYPLVSARVKSCLLCARCLIPIRKNFTHSQGDSSAAASTSSFPA